MKFIVDTQLPPKLARFLKAKGFDSIHTTFYPDGHLLDDNEIVVLAAREERTVISKDSDFLDNYLIKGAPPKILLVEFGNISNSNLIALFDKYIGEVTELFGEGHNLVLFRREEVVGY